MPSNNVMFFPGSPVTSKPFVVGDTPERIIGLMPEGARVKVYRRYDNIGDECEFDIPPIPFMCCDSCDTLSLFKQPYGDCYTGFLVQSEIVINSSGTFHLEYCCPYDEELPEEEQPECTEVPEDVYVWRRPEYISRSACS